MKTIYKRYIKKTLELKHSSGKKLMNYILNRNVMAIILTVGL